MTNEFSTLQTERLMSHMRVLCEQIGPRPPTSPQERQAADYVKSVLAELGLDNVQEQTFASQSTVGWVLVPALAAGALATPLARWGGRLGQVLGAALTLGSTWTIRDTSVVKPTVLQRLVTWGSSQNVIAHIPPQNRASREVILVGHLDSNKQRFSLPPPKPAWMKPFNTLGLLAGLANGLALLLGALRRPARPAWWQWLVSAALGGLALNYALEEQQPYIQGANDNATAVSVLLGIAEALQAHPLQDTHVTLLFTGCEEAGCVGMEAYLDAFAPPRRDSYWIDLEMVGTGNLCYVTRHGISYLSEYTPAPEMVELAAQTAARYPELGVVGKDMLIIEEIANLRRRGYCALCIAGYGEDGYLPNWHRLSDNLEQIEPDTLSRAARYTWALLQEIDDLE